MLLSSSYLSNGCVCLWVLCVVWNCLFWRTVILQCVNGAQTNRLETFVKFARLYPVQSLWQISTSICLWWRGWVQIYFQFAVYRSSQQGYCVYGSRMKCTNWWGNVVWQQIDFSSSSRRWWQLLDMAVKWRVVLLCLCTHHTDQHPNHANNVDDVMCVLSWTLRSITN